MHEMTIAKPLVKVAVERLPEASGDRVADVEVVLGSAARLSADDARGHFTLAARGTPAEGAALHIRWEPGRYWCLDCMFELSSRARGGGARPRCGGPVLGLDRDELAHVRAIGAGVR